MFVILSLFATNCFSMLCPTNFNTIDMGYTIDQVIQLCGQPDQQTEYKETVTFSNANSGGQFYGNYYPYPNSYYLQGQGNSQQLNDVKEKVIIHTKLIYHFPQATTLIFEDGILKDREFPH